MKTPEAAALAESEAFAHAILAALSDGLFIVQDQRFVFCNPALPALLGYTPQAFLQLGFDVMVAPESQAAWAAQVDPEGLHKGAQADTQGDLAFVQRDGQRLWLRLRATPFEHQGHRAVLGLVSDMTEHRRIVAELEQHRHHLEALVEERSEKAQAANRAKTAFLANMSHEIRTPLNAITGMVDLMRREASDATAARRLKTVDEAAQHLTRLLDDVLDLTKVESGKLSLEHIDFHLASWIAGNVALMADRAREKGLTLALDNQAPDGIWVCGDPSRLSQALLNLLGNAVKFTESGGVRLVCQLDLSLPAEPLLSLIIHDSGIGIPAHRIDQVFGAFEQADSSTTRLHGGTGLGLAITRHLAQLMQGELTVRSLQGQGSEFTFTARLQAAATPLATMTAQAPGELAAALGTEAQPEPAEAVLRREHLGARVLLAEDNPVNQLLACELLQAVGLTVDAVGDGLEAIDMARRYHYALVLMDVQMPHLDGLQACRMIRALPGLLDLPIIAMTANAFREDRKACLAAGMNDHVSKPVVPGLLYETLLRWL